MVNLSPDHESQSKWKGSSDCGGGLGGIFPSSVWWCGTGFVKIPQARITSQASSHSGAQSRNPEATVQFSSSVRRQCCKYQTAIIRDCAPHKGVLEEAPAAHESGSFDAVFPSKQPQAVSHVTVSDRQSFPAVFKPSQPPSTTKKPSSTPSGTSAAFLANTQKCLVEGPNSS
eukprot:g53011.t1